MRFIKSLPFLLFVAITLLITGSSRGQGLNLDLGTIKGESTFSLHPTTIDCNSFSLNCTNSGAGIVFGDLVVTKALDKSSPPIFLASAQATVIPTATLYLSKLSSSGTSSVDYYVIKLTNAKVSSISQNGDISNRPSESVTFRYQRIEIDYTPFTAQGQAQTPVVFKWDLTTNSGF